MSMMPARISTGSALQPSINFFRSGSSCATGICHPAAFALDSALHTFETAVFHDVSLTNSNPVSPIFLSAGKHGVAQTLAYAPPEGRKAQGVEFQIAKEVKRVN